MEALSAAPAVTTACTTADDSRITVDPAPAYTDCESYLLCNFQDANPGVLIDAAPRFWADGIQALCQTVPEFWNSYEGVVHNFDGGVVYGVKLDREGGPRALLTANRFVTRITAPKRVFTNAVGQKMNRKANDKHDTCRLNDLNTSLQSKNPVLAIMSSRCIDDGIRFSEGMQLFPMAQFRTTKTWPEKVDGGIV